MKEDSSRQGAKATADVHQRGLTRAAEKRLQAINFVKCCCSFTRHFRRDMPRVGHVAVHRSKRKTQGTTLD